MSTHPSRSRRLRERALLSAGVLALAGGGYVLAQTSAPARPAAPAAQPAEAARAGAAADPRAATTAIAAIAKRLEVEVGNVRPSVLPGLYEVVDGTEVLYATPDARYVLQGDLFDLDRRANLTEERRGSARVAALKAVPDAQAVVFGPRAPTYTITVFTDIDCGYCRKLHSEVAEYNKLGIRVRYVAYPRGGEGSEAWKKAESVWCASNRQDALTRAKAGEDLPARTCKGGAESVRKGYELGRELRIRGTPAIFTDGGDYVPGYVPPKQLAERLKALSAERGS